MHPVWQVNGALDYLGKLKFFFENTGFDIFENDGPYPGDVCASTSHPGHEGLHDSQWVQINLQKGLYQWMNATGNLYQCTGLVPFGWDAQDRFGLS
jgi:hypothetical protein